MSASIACMMLHEQQLLPWWYAYSSIECQSDFLGLLQHLLSARTSVSEALDPTNNDIGPLGAVQELQ